MKRTTAFLFAVVVVLTAVLLFAGWPRPAAAAAPGVTLVGQLDDLVLAGDPGGAHPGPQGITQSAADRRYCRLTGCTMTGLLTATAGITLSGTADLTLGASVDLNLGNSVTSAIRGGNSAFQRMDDGIGWYAQYTTATTILLDAVSATITGTLKKTGVATGSLPACNSATKEGGAEYDSTVNRWALCDDRGGSYAWRYIVTNATDTTVVTEESWRSDLATIPSTEAANYDGVFYFNAGAGGTGQTQRIVCQLGAGTAGVVGGAATGVVMAVRDITSGANVCTCTMSSGTAFCNAAAGATDSCVCSGALTSGRVFGVQMANTTDCGTNPGNVDCTVMWNRTLTTSQTP